MTTAAQKKAKEMYEHLRELRHQYNDLCKKAFPVGSEVSYAHGETLRTGVVEDVGYGHRLKIRGVCGTGYWIDTYRILDELDLSE